VYETKIHDIDDLQKRLTQIRFDFELDIIDAAVCGMTVCDHVCMLVADTLNACSEVHLYDLSHITNLSMDSRLMHLMAIL